MKDSEPPYAQDRTKETVRRQNKQLNVAAHQDATKSAHILLRKKRVETAN